MTPEQLANFILGATGVVIQLLFTYVPGFSDWYQNQSQKGLIALGFNVAFAGAYFALGCVPFVAQYFEMALACDWPSAFLVAQAIFVIAVSQQAAYGFLKKQVKARFGYG